MIKLNATILRVKKFFFKISLTLMEFSQALPSHHFSACRNFSMLHFSPRLIVFETDIECNVGIVLENHLGCGIITQFKNVCFYIQTHEKHVKDLHQPCRVMWRITQFIVGF